MGLGVADDLLTPRVGALLALALALGLEPSFAEAFHQLVAGGRKFCEGGKVALGP
ncbi:MAG: hypothetical protein M3355_01550 [Actinomycetota bacterium]|nr:hypothetical protein [Actinomycetota bacterium]